MGADEHWAGGMSTALNTTVDYWVRKIRPSLDLVGCGMVSAGTDLVRAKESVAHGGFGQLLDELDIDPRMAQRLMKIAHHRVLANATHGSHLPSSWRTLSELARLDDDELTGAIDEGLVHPEMTRGDAARLVAGGSEDLPNDQLEASLDEVDAQVVDEIADWFGSTPDDSTISAEEIPSDPHRLAAVPPAKPVPKQQSGRRRLPLPVRIQEATVELDKILTRLEKLVADDRFGQHEEVVAGRLRLHLDRAVALRDRLEGSA